MDDRMLVDHETPASRARTSTKRIGRSTAPLQAFDRRRAVDWVSSNVLCGITARRLGTRRDHAVAVGQRIMPMALSTGHTPP